MSSHQLTAISADQRLADYQRRYDQAQPPERQSAVTRVLRFTGEYGIFMLSPATFPIAVAKFGYNHRANSRCVAEALQRSDPRMKQLLVKQFEGISMEMVYPVLKEIAKEVAIYVGGGAVVGGGVGALFGGVGALPGATVGARVGFWLMTLLGLGKLLVYVASEALPQMVSLYTSGFAKAWSAGELPQGETAKRAQLMHAATEDFAHGHIKLLIAILTAVVVYLTKGQMKTLVAELNASKLGPKFAQWIQANETRLVRHPALQPQKPVGQVVREAQEHTAAKAQSQRPTPRQSEIDVGRDLGPGHSPQASYKNRESVRYGTRDSVRPDYVSTNGSVSFEVKNYNIANNSNGLINNVSKQATERHIHLPSGMQQKVIIDVRGQSLSPLQEDTIIRGIVHKSGGIIKPTAITFKGKTGS